MSITIHRDGQNYGPFSLDDVRQHLGTGSLMLTDLALSMVRLTGQQSTVSDALLSLSAGIRALPRPQGTSQLMTILLGWV